MHKEDEVIKKSTDFKPLQKKTQQLEVDNKMSNTWMALRIRTGRVHTTTKHNTSLTDSV